MRTVPSLLYLTILAQPNSLTRCVTSCYLHFTCYFQLLLLTFSNTTFFQCGSQVCTSRKFSLYSHLNIPRGLSFYSLPDPIRTSLCFEPTYPDVLFHVSFLLLFEILLVDLLFVRQCTPLMDVICGSLVCTKSLCASPGSQILS